jgi:hypothetical protein
MPFKLDDPMTVTYVLAPDQFIAIYCFAGCDYINRMGIQTGLKFFRR